MKEEIVKLTKTVYRVLEFFPENDPLKIRAKEKVLAIVEHLSLINETSGWMSFQKEKVKAQLSEDVDILLSYLRVAKAQGWLNSVNYLIISNEYEKIKKENKAISVPESVIKSEGAAKEYVPDSFKLSGRQEKIIDFLSKNKKAQVADLQTILKDVTKRTIRRDLDELLKTGRIARSGDFNQVFYTIS